MTERGYQLRTIFLQPALKFEILPTTLYKCAVLLQSWNYKASGFTQFMSESLEFTHH